MKLLNNNYYTCKHFMEYKMIVLIYCMCVVQLTLLPKEIGLDIEHYTRERLT